MIGSGTRLGPYEIIAPVGAGGMGEVYRARDTRLGRDVAIKVLPSHLSSNPSLRERFDREARAISNLTHPHICTLHDIGRQDGTDYLVMEFLEGETLADRLARGSLPLKDVIRYGAEIAEALDKAHKQGIVHRDLKPGNVMITKGGAKVLDFGLAKYAANPELGTRNSELTVHKPITEEGTILGTIQYMAPEQLEGKEADPRTDIFALGAILYEMATGKRAFEGKSRASLIASIMSAEPQPISTIAPMTPPALDRIVRTCLEKEPDDRWQSARDVARELKWISDATGEAAAASRRRRVPRRELIAWTVAALALIAAVVLPYVLTRRAPAAPAGVTSSILPPEGLTFRFGSEGSGSLSISPNGRYLTFSARKAGSRPLLWLRDLGSTAARPIAGTEGATFPFWSPDSRFVAFFADGKLKKVDIRGGPAITICKSAEGRPGGWNRDGVIIFAPHWRESIYRVSAAGGEPVPVTRIDPERSETTHRWATFLPDGKHFIYLAGSHLAEVSSELNAIYAGSLDSAERKLILRARSNIIYVPGYLLFVRDRHLVAQPFNTEKLELTGEPVLLAENVRYNIGFLRGVFAAADNGTLVYQTAAGSGDAQLYLLDAKGDVKSKLGEPAEYYFVNYSPDGRRLAVVTGDPSDIWIFDVTRGVRTRFTSHPLNDGEPVWSPDGKAIVFSSDRNIQAELFVKPLTMQAEQRVLAEPKQDLEPAAWSPDGRYVLYRRFRRGESKSDLWVLPMFGDRQPFVYLNSQFDEWFGEFSPDGKWIIFNSDETGRDEVYAGTFPQPTTKIQISTNGGRFGFWFGDTVFFENGERDFVAAPVRRGEAGLEFGEPRVVFARDRFDKLGEIAAADMVYNPRQYAFALRPSEVDQPPLTLVQNWTAALDQ